MTRCTNLKRPWTRASPKTSQTLTLYLTVVGNPPYNTVANSSGNTN